MGGKFKRAKYLVDVDPVRVLPRPVDVGVRVARGLAGEQDVVARECGHVRRQRDELRRFWRGMILSLDLWAVDQQALQRTNWDTKKIWYCGLAATV